MTHPSLGPQLGIWRILLGLKGIACVLWQQIDHYYLKQRYFYYYYTVKRITLYELMKYRVRDNYNI